MRKIRLRAGLLLVSIVLLIPLAGCAKNRVATTLPQLTPQQKLVAAKLGALGAATGIRLRIGSLERDAALLKPEDLKLKKLETRLKFLRVTSGIVDEFNNQFANVVSLDVDARTIARGAIERAINGADNLERVDLLTITDAGLKADIKAGIDFAKSLFQSFDEFFPPTPPN